MGARIGTLHLLAAVLLCLATLHAVAGETVRAITPLEVLRQYGHWITFTALLLLLALAWLLYSHRLNQGLRRQRKAITDLNRNLEQRVIERTAEISRLLSHVSDLLNSTAEGILGLDLEGRCTFANPACLRLLGYAEAYQLVGQDVHALIHARRADGTPYPRETCPVLRATRQGEGSHVLDEVLWRADGSNFPVEYWSYPIRRHGEVTGVVVTFLDISEHKRGEEALRRSQKMEAIGQLTGGIAHDFNNLLGIILGNLSLMRQQVAGDTRMLKRLLAIEQAAQRGADLTRQLLGFSRSHPTQLVVTDLNRLIEETESLITRSLTPLITVERCLAQDLWPAEIDPGDFQDALLNLVINARDAMPGGGRLILETSNARLDPTFSPAKLSGDFVQIAVSDNGEGIPAELRDRIFEPFYTTKPPGKGTGLGLAMVYGFVQRSGGLVKVYSELGIGTTFRLYLPRAAKELLPEATPVDDGSALPRGHETILAVDDEEGLLELTQTTLEGLGYRVLTASSGPQALEVLAAEPGIDLLFSDIVMPGGLNGYDLAEQAQALRPKIKILLTSGYTRYVVPHNGQVRFETNLLSKPYTLAGLAQRVRELLGETPQEGTIPGQWTESLSLSIESMDSDHRGLLEMLNQSRSNGAPHGTEGCRRILDRLQAYVENHLAREEAVMAACGYPGREEHRQVHRFLMERTAKMRRQLERGELSGDELTAFLKSWWLDHILGMDRAYASYCHGKEALIAQALARMPPLSTEEATAP